MEMTSTSSPTQQQPHQVHRLHGVPALENSVLPQALPGKCKPGALESPALAHKPSAASCDRSERSQHTYGSWRARAAPDDTQASLDAKRVLFANYFVPDVPTWQKSSWSAHDGSLRRCPSLRGSATSSPADKVKHCAHPSSPFAVNGTPQSLGLTDSPAKQGGVGACWPEGMGQRRSPAQILLSPPHAVPVVQQQRRQLRKLCRELDTSAPVRVMHALQTSDQEQQVPSAMDGRMSTATLFNIARLVEVPELAQQACQALIAASSSSSRGHPQTAVLDACIPVLISSLPAALGGCISSLPPCTLAGVHSQQQHGKNSSGLKTAAAVMLWQQVSMLRSPSVRLAALGVLREMTRSRLGSEALMRSPKLMQLLGVHVEAEQVEMPCKVMAARVCLHLTWHSSSCRMLCKDDAMLRQLRIATTQVLCGWAAYCITTNERSSEAAAADDGSAQEASSRAMEFQALRLLQALTGVMCGCVHADATIVHALLHVPFRHNAPCSASRALQITASSGSIGNSTILGSQPADSTMLPSAAWYQDVPDELHTTASTRVLTAAVQLLYHGMVSRSTVAMDAVRVALELLACVAMHAGVDDSSRLQQHIQTVWAAAAASNMHRHDVDDKSCAAALLHMLQQPDLSVATRTHAMQLLWLLSQGHIHNSSSSAVMQQQLLACCQALQLCNHASHPQQLSSSCTTMAMTARAETATAHTAVAAAVPAMSGGGSFEGNGARTESSGTTITSSRPSKHTAGTCTGSTSVSHSESGSDTGSDATSEGRSDSQSQSESDSGNQQQCPTAWVIEAVDAPAAGDAHTAQGHESKHAVHAGQASQQAASEQPAAEAAGPRSCNAPGIVDDAMQHALRRSRHFNDVLQLRSSTLAVLNQIAACPGCVHDATRNQAICNSDNTASFDSLLTMHLLPLLQTLTTKQPSMASTTADNEHHACGTAHHDSGHHASGTGISSAVGMRLGDVRAAAGVKQLHVQRQVLLLLGNLCAHAQGAAQLVSATGGVHAAMQVLQAMLVDQPQLSCAPGGIRHGKASEHGMLETSYDSLLAKVVKPASAILANWWHHQATAPSGAPAVSRDVTGSYGLNQAADRQRCVDQQCNSPQEAARVLGAAICKLLPTEVAMVAADAQLQHLLVQRRSPSSSPAKPSPKPTALPQHLTVSRLKTVLQLLVAMGHVGACMLCCLQQQQHPTPCPDTERCEVGENVQGSMQEAASGLMQTVCSTRGSDQEHQHEVEGSEQFGQADKSQQKQDKGLHGNDGSAVDGTGCKSDSCSGAEQLCSTGAAEHLLSAEDGLRVANTVAQLLCDCAPAVPLNQAGQLNVDNDPLTPLLLNVMQAALRVLCMLVAVGAAPPLPLARQLLPHLSTCLASPSQHVPAWCTSNVRSKEASCDAYHITQDQGGSHMDAVLTSEPRLLSLRAHTLAWLQLSCSLEEVAYAAVRDTSLVHALMQLLKAARSGMSGIEQSTMMQLEAVLCMLRPYDRYHMRGMEALRL